MNAAGNDLLRRYLQQRREIGETALLLERLSAGELRSLLRAAAAPASVARGAAAGPAENLGGGAAVGDVVEHASAPPREADPRSRIEVAAGAPAHGTPALDLVSLGSLEELREVALGCPRCRLAETRRTVVFGEGVATARVMVVGEAPGAEEDRAGRPFVGKAGQLLDTLLASVGFERESVYICNVIKCRPPGNRNPEPEEVEACSPYLLRQIELIAPTVILALGAFAAQTLLGSETKISKLRGAVHDFRGIPLVPTYHPAALLRNGSWIRPVWDDLQRLRQIADAAA